MTAGNFYDDYSAEEVENELNGRHGLGTPGEPSYGESSLGEDHLYQE